MKNFTDHYNDDDAYHCVYYDKKDNCVYHDDDLDTSASDKEDEPTED